MKYSNPRIPENINVTDEHPLKEFAWLVGAVAAIAVVLLLLFGFFGEYLAKQIPFEYEQRLAADVPLPDTLPKGEWQAYLQGLADRLIVGMDLPEGMAITVHVVDNDMVNAFATLGGHVVFYRGLLERLPHENALAMVMAHEIAHVKHRHPAAALGRGVMTGLLITTLTGPEAGAGADFLGSAGLLSSLSFSRDAEREADREALAAVQRLYGHVSGATALFSVLMQAQGNAGFTPPEFVSTHPLTEERIQAMREYAHQQGWAQKEPLTALKAIDWP